MSATQTPPRSPDQRHEALAVANGIRSERAKLKTDLKAGRASFLQLVEDPPEWLRSAKMFDMLTAVSWVGPVTAASMMKQAGVSPVKTMGGLTTRQREALMLAMWHRKRSAMRRSRWAK